MIEEIVAIFLSGEKHSVDYISRHLKINEVDVVPHLKDLENRGFIQLVSENRNCRCNCYSNENENCKPDDIRNTWWMLTEEGTEIVSKLKWLSIVC